MLNLFINENMKIYRRPRTWIMIILLIALTCTMIFVRHNETAKHTSTDWKTSIQKQNTSIKKMLQEKEISEAKLVEIQDNLKLNEYRLEHDLPPDRSIWDGVLDAANLIIIVTIFTVIIAADSVAGEFSGGTIKLLLTRQAGRSKILLSKYMSILIFAVLLLGALFGSAFLLSGLAEGFKGIGTPYVYMGQDHIVHQIGILGHFLSTYGYKCVELIMIVTLAFMLSTVLRSSSLAIGLSLGFLFLGTSIVGIISRYSWSKYYLFTNMDLSQYLNNSPRIEGMTLSFSITVLFVYFFLFNILSWSIFKKRDI